jgi:CarboxypepD_reg-like domain/Secretion system C-terminal sorting domain
MSKHIQLHIPEPCHENWNNMTPVEKGRFCGSCQKQVVDFSRMNDEQLVVFFRKRSTGSVCGRFMQDQLGRSMAVPGKRIPWVKYFFQFALPAFLMSKKASAQGQVRILAGDTILTQAAPNIDAVKKTANKLKQEKVIRGKVVDEMGEGISYASIFIKGTTMGVAADSSGSFSLKYSGQENSIVLVSSSIGYEEVETEVDLIKIDRSVIASLPADNTLNEVIVVASPAIRCRSMIMGGAFSVIERTSFVDTVWNEIFPVKQSLNTYPNPVRTNSLLTIEIGKNEKGTHSIQLVAANGQIRLTKEFWLEKDSRVVKLNIPSIATGTYFLQVINKQSGATITEKIIVE